MRISPETALFGEGRVTTASANQMFEKRFESFSDEDLLFILDPINKREMEKKYSDLTSSERIENITSAFRVANRDDDYGPQHRSEIQDRLIAASNQRCNIYETYLKRISTYTNGIFGTLTTVLGGAGAIVTGEQAARTLSGLAGISSGTRSELNQAVFESITTSVIIPGIQNRRNEILQNILSKREEPLSNYTIQGAIADVIKYHGACSMDTGIAYAQKSIQAYEDIGLTRSLETQENLKLMRSLSEPSALKVDRELVAATTKLNEFSSTISEYLKLVKPEQTPLHNKLLQLKNSSTDGELRTKASLLDSELKELLINYFSTKGVEKSKQYSLLEAQQIKVEAFIKDLEAENAMALAEVKNQ